VKGAMKFAFLCALLAGSPIPRTGIQAAEHGMFFSSPRARVDNRVPAGHGAVAGRGQAESRVRNVYLNLPLRFEVNQGQMDPRAKFIARGNNYALFLMSGEAVLYLNKPSQGIGREPNIQEPVPNSSDADIVQMRIVGADSPAGISALEELPGRTNYFIGGNPSNWRSNVASYAKVKYKNIYPGIDLIYHGKQGQLEYDFVVAPGTYPGIITLAFAISREQGEAGGLQIDADGNLVIETSEGVISFRKPRVYQEIGGSEQVIAGRYVDRGKGQVGFEIGEYDRTKPLIIDPVLIYSTYLGGNDADYGVGIAVDSTGEAFVVGHTFSNNFPVFSSTTPFQQTRNGGADVFVTKFNSDGSALEYSTYLGGSGNDYGQAITIDSTGNAYVTGRTESTNFPVAGTPFQATCGTCASSNASAFVAKLDSTGSNLLYSTYLGGSNQDEGHGIGVDSSGNAYVTGITASSNFPLTPANALRTSFVGSTEAFVTGLDSTGLNLLYSTFLGGTGSDSGEAIAVDSAGKVYVAGYTTSPFVALATGAFQGVNKGGTDGFVGKLDPSQSGSASLVYFTFLGGTAQEKARGIAVNSAGEAYVTGFTESNDFPVANAAQTTKGGGTGSDAFVTKLSADATSAIFSTYLGGSDADRGRSIAVDTSDNAYFAGFTLSIDFPTVNPFQASLAGGRDAFVVKINPAGSLVYSSYLGGIANENGNDGAFVAVDAGENAYVTGDTVSSDFPLSNAYQSMCGSCTIARTDGFVAKVASIPVPVVQLSPAALDFLDLGVGNTSSPKAVTLTNKGDAVMTISNITITGTNSGDFALSSHTCPLTPNTLGAGGKCTINVTFMPQAVGTRSADVTITDEAADSPQKVSLTGNGITGAYVALSATSVNFASRPIGTTSAAQTVTLSNPGNATLTISSIALSGMNSIDFAETDNCVGNVAINANCTISVTFTPSAEGARTATVTITSNAQNGTRTISLSGTGTTPDFSVSATPSEASIVAGKKATYMLMITPLGGSTQNVNLTCSGVPQASTCSVTPTSVTLDGSNTATAQFTVNTKSRSLATPPPGGYWPGSEERFPSWTLWLLSLLILVSVAALRRRVGRVHIALGVTLLALLFSAACGGGSGGGGGGSNAGTPAGTYTLTFTATSGSTSHSTTATLTVN
jgi:Beta-propeller repeat/Cep192 domain 4/HYDIN/CFA65/VesB-like, Ig-like domain